MTDTPAIPRETLRALALDTTGASAVGIVRPGPVDDEAVEVRRRWIDDGCHGSMDYLTRYDDVRRDPRLLLDGAATLVVALFDYANGGMPAGLPAIAEYALGTDYHTELRRRMGRLAEALVSARGGDTRITVDTAPMRERYWAVRAGLGVTGVHNQLIRPGHGAHYFIASLLWTGRFDGPDDTPLTGDCGRCMACVRACPAGALTPDGRLDARRCLSYLTIESRSPLPDGMTTGGRLFGCDACRLACPHERTDERTAIDAFRARPDILTLDRDAWTAMSPSRFRSIFADSAVLRARLPKLLDTLAHLGPDSAK